MLFVLLVLVSDHAIIVRTGPRFVHSPISQFALLRLHKYTNSMSTSLRRLHVPFRKLWPPRAGARLFPAYHTFGSSRARWGKDAQILRMHSDPEYRKKRYESSSAVDKKRYYENHEYHELKKKVSRDWCRSHAHNPIYKIRNHISKWTRFAWVREELDWKSHVPIYSDTRVVRYCKSCEHAGIRGTKIWW